MPDTPIADALKKIPQNELEIEGGASQHDGAGVHVTFERANVKGDLAGGVAGGISQREGWSVMGFFRKRFGR